MGCSGVGLARGFVSLQVKSPHPENPDDYEVLGLTRGVWSLFEDFFYIEVAGVGIGWFGRAEW